MPEHTAYASSPTALRGLAGVGENLDSLDKSGSRCPEQSPFLLNLCLARASASADRMGHDHAVP